MFTHVYLYVLHKLYVVLRKWFKRVREREKKEREKKRIKEEIVGTLRASDILWRICGPEIRRSRDSILSSESNHMIWRRRLAVFYAVFYSFTEDEEMNCLLRCSCWTFGENLSVVSIHIWCLSICLMYMCILYCHLNYVHWTTFRQVVYSWIIFWTSNIYATLPLQKSLVSSNKILQEKKIVFAFYIKLFSSFFSKTLIFVL